MKSYLQLAAVFLVMFSVALPSKAEFLEIQLSNNENFFEKIGNMFSNGVLPDLARISDISWAGRCFTITNPNTPRAGGSIFREKKLDYGPIGQTLKVYEASTHWKPKEPANYYDRLPIDQVLADPKIQFRDVKIKQSYAQIVYQAGYTTVTSKLKISAPYLVEEVEEYGSATIRCYYFEPTLNP